MNKEPVKEIVDSSKNIFGKKGELLSKKKSHSNKDNPVCIDIEAEDSETPAPLAVDSIMIDEEESKDASS